MKRTLLVLATLPLLGGGCWDRFFAVKETTNIPIVFENPYKKTAETVTLGDVTGTESTSGFVAPPVKPGEIASASGNVVVTSLVPKQTLTNPFVILGRSRSFENSVNWRIRDKNWNVLASGASLTDASDVGVFGSFRVRAFLVSIPKTAAGFAEVFTLSPKDGSEQDVVSIAITLSLKQTILKINFSNIMKDPELKMCEKTYPVTRRVAKTAEVAEAALLELLDGPTEADLTEGFRTAIVPGTRLRSVKVEGDTATVDFSREIVLGITDPCILKALKSQIEQTLKQFSNVKQVKILIDGKSADAVFNL